MKLGKQLDTCALKELLVGQNRMAQELSQLWWRRQDVVSQVNKLSPHFGQIFESVFRVLMKQFDDYKNHVIREDVVFKEWRNFVHILIWSILMQSFVADVLQNL